MLVLTLNWIVIGISQAASVLMARLINLPMSLNRSTFAKR
ncbi:Uncharacterised protein [Vibrio cholerae]|nr:Uncharacterised protein [Vibrio cholerae]